MGSEEIQELTVNEQVLFIKKLILTYKELPILWDQSHPNYRQRKNRIEAYKILIEKSKDYNPDADEDWVRSKIDSLRCCFRKEHRKVMKSREECKDPDDIYVPTLWYYDLMKFTKTDKDDNDEITQNKTTTTTTTTTTTAAINPKLVSQMMKMAHWDREHTVMLIKLYKVYPCLYSTTCPEYRSKWKRIDALKSISKHLLKTTGKRFHPRDVRRKISAIRNQFTRELKKVRAHRGTYKPNLWCFEMLKFLEPDYNEHVRLENNKTGLLTSNNSHCNNESLSEDSSCEEVKSVYQYNKICLDITNSRQDMEDIKKEADLPTSEANCDNLETNQEPEDDSDHDDLYDTIAKNVAHKLRDMVPEQREISERILMDLMYHGQMENLCSTSHLVLQ